jgi:hypothetical protein
MTGRTGTLLFSPHIVMEESKIKEMKETPELGMLLKDPNIARALSLSMQQDVAAENKLKDLIEAYIRKNNLQFNSFEIVRFLIAERKLQRVDGLVYGNLPGFNIPADTELEVPEKYNR